MRALYTLLWHLVLPWLPVRLWWRGRQEPGYRNHIGERFARYATPPDAPVIWLHAVSLGETQAARPLIERIQAHYPGATLLLTHMTATGRAAGRAFAGPRVVQAWLPYDVPRYTRRFLAHFRPVAGLLLETELWPNLVRAATAANVPLYLVNARLSERSARGYARIARLSRPAFAALTGVAAQTADDAQRLDALGAPAPVVTGNLKFDVAIPQAARNLGQTLRQRFGPRRPVWLAASTRDGEETLLLDAVAAGALPERTLTVLVPRHPQRFQGVAQLLTERGLRFVRRSEQGNVPPEVAFVVGDSMGEMAAYCAAADVVLMGGSLLPLGGQNLIEPLAAGRPTVLGPHMFNFADVAGKALASGAAVQVGDANEAIAVVAALLADPGRRAAMQAAAATFHAAHRGATDRLWAWLAPRLDVALRTDSPPPRPQGGHAEDAISRRDAG